MSNVYLRKAEYSDMDLLFGWANDPTVRSNSFNTSSIPYDDHVKWFKKMMENDKILQFIMMYDTTPIGQIRLNIDGDEAEIGYSIAKEYRGQGYGHSILRLVAEVVDKEHQEIKYLIAKVKPENIASNKLFQNEGYTVQYTSYILEIVNNID